MIHIPARTPLAWYHCSWEAPLWKPLNVPRTSPSSLTLTKLALAVAYQLKITRPRRHIGPDDMCLHGNPRWQVVGGQRLNLKGIMWPRGHGRVQERQDGQRREGYSVRKAAAAMTRKIPTVRERERERECLISTLHYHSLGNINMPFAIELKSSCH